MTVEAVFQDRDTFATMVREVAAPDLGRMGIEILSFTIKDVYDNVEYLDSLGKTQTAMVKRDAAIGVAEANRDAGIKVTIDHCFCISCISCRKRTPRKRRWMSSTQLTHKSPMPGAICCFSRRPSTRK